VGEWDLALECLADRVLWDRDWELDELLDLPPDRARAVKHSLGISRDYFAATPTGQRDAAVATAAAALRRLADADRADQEYLGVTLQYGGEGLVGLRFAEPGLDRRHGRAGAEIVHEVSAVLPRSLALDVATVLRRIEQAEPLGASFTQILRARERLNHRLHGFLPESLRGQYWQVFEIAPGIAAERDYGTYSAEFDLAKYTGLEFDDAARQAAAAATDGLVSFLLNLVSDPDYRFADDAVRQALIATAEELASRWTGGGGDEGE
jgi:hypothetical protein